MSEHHREYPHLQEAEERAIWIATFEERYGLNAYARLLARFDDLYLSYAEIAAEFGVTRERARQWHHLLVPGAPRGHQRRRARSVYSRKRRLLSDPLFRTFVRAARGRVPASLVTPVSARDGFRKREVRVGPHRLLLKRAAVIAPGVRRAAEAQVYALSGTREHTDYVFFALAGSDFLVLPATLLPAAGTTFTDTESSPYRSFKNRFDAVTNLAAAGHRRNSGDASVSTAA